MTKLITAIALALALSGCAVCQRHEVACTVAVAVVAGSVAATVAAQNGGTSPQQPVAVRGWHIN